MSYFEEAKLCTAQEYNRHINNRLDFNQVQNDELVMLMILLNGIHEAAKIPARLIEKSTPKGLLFVEVALVDNNLRNTYSKTFAVKDDFLLVDEANFNVIYDGVKSYAVEGYGRDYFEDQMPPSFRNSTALELAS